jgi:uncharacterized protein YaeQ
MALPATVYRANIQLSHVDRSHYEAVQTTVARHPSETEERLVARLLAYALCYEPELAFGKGIGVGDEPDLWVKGPDGRVQRWIEVGLPDPDRLLKACRHAGQVILLACGAALPRWTSQHLAKLASAPNLTVIGLDQAFLNQVVSRLQRAINWELTVTEGALYLTIDGNLLQTTLTHLAGPPVA